MSDRISLDDPAAQAQGAEQIRPIARRYEIDRYLAALLAPRAARDDLIALAAFSGELHRIGESVSDPMLGEIRLQWWRDALDSGARGERTGHPTADAVIGVIQRHNLPRDSLSDMLDAHTHRLYADPPPDHKALSLELDLIEGTLFDFAARVLSCGQTPLLARAVQSAGRAYGLARVATALALPLSRGREPFPPQAAHSAAVSDRDWRTELAEIAARCRGYLVDFRGMLAELGHDRSAVITAMLPLAVVEPYLRALQRRDHDPLRNIAEIAPLTRVARIAGAHLRRRL
ncbi:MAG: squalene/phytoene synthase family protein [Hyphomicrobium sp.]|nr:squalene/phytoene synthase family protein [Hyphomicrobium sp.]